MRYQVPVDLTTFLHKFYNFVFEIACEVLTCVQTRYSNIMPPVLGLMLPPRGRSSYDLSCDPLCFYRWQSTLRRNLPPRGCELDWFTVAVRMPREEIMTFVRLQRCSQLFWFERMFLSVQNVWRYPRATFWYVDGRRQHSRFAFRKSRVQISGPTPVVVSKGLPGFPQFLQKNMRSVNNRLFSHTFKFLGCW